MTLSAAAGKGAYTGGEVPQIHYECRNGSSQDITKFTARLVRRLRFTADNNKSNSPETTMVEVALPGLEKGMTCGFDDKLSPAPKSKWTRTPESRRGGC